MKVTYDGKYDGTGFKHEGKLHILRKGENEVPDEAVESALKVDGASLPNGVKLPTKKTATRSPKKTPTAVAVPAVEIKIDGAS